ncbi:MAG: electron transport complex subunit RsxC [Muribaculaceae bacterium]|nr:electron transport complex subunit RsxC [Muribaculaceae bacterium]
MKTFSKGGVHPPEQKLTAGNEIITLDLPGEVTLMLGQHIGAPAKPVVAKGDKVKRGDVIAEAGGFVSAPVHTPISGTVVKVDTVKNQQGLAVPAVYIKADADDAAADAEARKNAKPARTDAEIAALQAGEIKDIIKGAGIVGLGGATFPTHVKLSPPPEFKPEVVIINAVECEPYITADHRLMLEHPDEVIEGVRLLARSVGVNRAVIGIESNKPDAIALLQEKLAGATDVEVCPLKVKYPQGGEKQLIEAVIGREVPSGALPIATGAVVQNVATAYAVHRAVRYGEPLMERIATVTGPGVAKPGNFLFAIGTPLTTLIEAAGGLPEDTGKVIGGGPMMGRTISNLDSPAVKGTSALLIFSQGEAQRRPIENCIRCAKCVDVCPMGLEPYLLSTLSRLKRWDDAEAEKIVNCIECGSCSFICPASRPLLDFIRLGKATVMANIRSRKS